MYTLRRISGQGVEMNFALGQSYTVVHRFTAYESFKRDFEKMFERPHVADLDPTADENTKSVYALVGTHGGEKVYPLYFGQQAYIMTESGSTFSNLTMKSNVKG
jgi:hypothetical protein